MRMNFVLKIGHGSISGLCNIEKLGNFCYPFRIWSTSWHICEIGSVETLVYFVVEQTTQKMTIFCLIFFPFGCNLEIDAQFCMEQSHPIEMRYLNSFSAVCELLVLYFHHR